MEKLTLSLSKDWKECRHTRPIFKEYEYYVGILYVGIKDLPRFGKNSSILVSTCDVIINAGLGCRSFNVEKIFISTVPLCSKVFKKT